MQRPKLRPLETHWVQHQGQQVLLVRDPLHLSDKTLLVPPALAAFLALCDGTRDLATLRAGFGLRTGIAITPEQVAEIIAQLDEGLLLEGLLYDQARSAALARFRSSPHRTPALAGAGYPEEASALRVALAEYVAGAREGVLNSADGRDSVCGIITPHIDYHRGGSIYPRAWLPAAEALRSADLVVLLGTDHCGSAGQITLTKQRYATPLGKSPTATDVVDSISDALGGEATFAEELHHVHEHSIELATVWLHYVLGGTRVNLLPILCGSFHRFIEGSDPEADERTAALVDAVRRATKGRRVVYVAAADLAHVGPFFGDPQPFGPGERRLLEAADSTLLDAAVTGSARAFFECVRAERDSRRICGLPPIYLMLRFMEEATGEVTGYAQCPADAREESWVTVAAAVYRKAP